ncbi:PAS domain-containing protein [Methylobacterium sp. JK268]
MALGRSDDFDPNKDAIVRVEARRLRKIIEQVYSDPQISFNVRIELPVGHYEPVFRHGAARGRGTGHPHPGDVALSEALASSEQRYRTRVEASAVVEWSADARGLMVGAQGWTERTGQEQDALQGEGWLAALHPQDRDRVAAAWAEACRTARPIEITCRVRHLDRTYRWLRMRGVPIENDDGTVRGWVGTAIDAHHHRDASAGGHAEAQRTTGYEPTDSLHIRQKNIWTILESANRDRLDQDHCIADVKAMALRCGLHLRSSPAVPKIGARSG